MHRQSSPKSTPHRRWTPSEDALLHRLRVLEHLTWPKIAEALNRTPHAVATHYHQLKLASAASFEDWDATKDAQIIDGRGRGLTTKEISVEMGVPADAVQGRWYELQQLKRVPEDVLAIWRRKGEVHWTEKEDEEILRAWIEGTDVETIARGFKFEGKSMVDIRKRSRLLLREQGPIYRRLMRLDEKKPAPNALSQALGENEFVWMT